MDTTLPLATGGVSAVTPTYGIDKLIKLTDAVCEVVGDVDGILQGGITLSDAARIPGLLTDLKDFYELDWSQVLPQAQDLSASEAVVLADHFKKKFDIASNDVEVIIEQGVELVVRGVEAFVYIKEIASKLFKKTA
jgi:hypothetical protein